VGNSAVSARVITSLKTAQLLSVLTVIYLNIQQKIASETLAVQSTRVLNIVPNIPYINLKPLHRHSAAQLISWREVYSSVQLLLDLHPDWNALSAKMERSAAKVN